MSTFFFAGQSSCDYGSIEGTYPQIGSNYYITFYAEVIILYGNYVGTDNIRAIPPVGNLPVFPPNLPFTAKLYHAANWNNPTTPAGLDSPPIDIVKVDLIDQDNPHNCLGAKYICITRTFPNWTIDTTPYTLVYSMSNVEIPYGADIIKIASMSGNSAPLGPDW